jgi:hypothetical protein
MSGWLPIATAPKDGTKIDLLFPYPRGRTIDCYWGASDLYGGDTWIWRTPTWGQGELLPEGQWYIHCYPNMEPTHWMLPPDPPEPSP